jgi:uncharacterized protein (UPF0332 family)
MHHCARAALLANGGVGKIKDVPDSHEHVIEHFGKLVGDADKPDGLGLLLNRARGERIISDYDLEDAITASQAADAARKATYFVEHAEHAGICDLESAAYSSLFSSGAVSPDPCTRVRSFCTKE